MAPLRRERYSRDAVRLKRGGDVVGMLLRHADDRWSINDRNERALTKRRFLNASDAFDHARECLADLLDPLSTPLDIG